jgi:hypothetical protein
MKKSPLLLLLILFFFEGFAQVGIGTNTPHNSAILDVAATDKGILFPKMTSAQRTAIVSPATGLHVYDTNTNSLWLFNGAAWANTASAGTYGDIKSGIQTTDHSGWVRLDGRATNASSLTASQQAVLTSLGITGNLPNANSAYPVQNGTTLGSVSGSNTTTLVQANLPSVNFSTSVTNAGNHSHNVDPGGFWSSANGEHNHGSNATGGPNGYGLVYANGHATLGGSDYTWGEPNGYATPGALSIYNAGNHQHIIDVPNTGTTTNGDHGHTVTVASGGSSTPINIAPRSLSVNMFIYLGF